MKICPYCKKEPIVDKRTRTLLSSSVYEEWRIHCANPAGLSTIWHSIKSEAERKWDEMVTQVEEARKRLGR